MHTDPAIRGVSFDLFGTLVTVERPANPAAAVAVELDARGVAVPDDWQDAYGEMHVAVPPGAELSLPEHVAAALASRAPSLAPEDVREPATDAVRAAFDVPVETRVDAPRTVAALAERVPVGVLSNCSVPGLAERALAASGVDESHLDAVVTSVGCGWRKPDRRAFAAVADALSVDPTRLLHVGDDPQADGGAADAGARSLLVGGAGEASIGELPRSLEGRWA
jgi:FMN phosphatase YigB (HAD superfamily)